MKIKELRQMSKSDRDAKFAELERDIMKLRVSTRSGPGNTAKIRAFKKDIARILTLKKNE